jgi:hypothetical protein
MPVFVEKVLVYKDRVDVVFKIHVPDGENDDLMPLTSGEQIQTIKDSCKQAV